MEQVLAETAGRDLLLEVARRRRQDAHVDLDLGLAAVAGVGLFLQHPRQPALQRQRQVGHFLEHQRAAMRHLEGAGHAQRVGVGVAVGAEQLDLQPLGRQGRAIDHDERTVGALRSLVDQPRHRFLARAGGAGDEDAAAGRRHASRSASAHWPASLEEADEGHVAAGATAQLRVLALQLVGLDGAVDDQQQAVGLEGLLDEVIGAAS